MEQSFRNSFFSNKAKCRYSFYLSIAVFLSGCSSFSTGDMSNPTPIHREGKISEGLNTSALDNKAIEAGSDLAVLYYEALDAAKAQNATQPQIDNYVRIGSNLVETYCVRWFKKLADAQRRLEFSESNRNVISQLGTALIGISRLNSDVTTVYGAANTALAGFSENVNAAYLIAPNSENVKQLVMQALKERSALLRNPNSALYPNDFSSAYAELEQLADICTYGEAKRISTQAVENSKAKINESTGQVFVVSAASGSQVPLKNRINDLIKDIDALDNDQSLTLIRLMPFKDDKEIQKIILARDPQDRRFSNQDQAKKIAKMVLILTAKNEESLGEWEVILNSLNERKEIER